MSANTNVQTLTEPGVSSAERVQLDKAAAKSGQGVTGPTLAIAQREWMSLFYSPIAYVAGFIFLLLTAYFFVSETMVGGNEASMRVLFERMAGILVFAIPLLTMRSVAEEFSTNSIETLMTAPVSDASVIMGKFLGVMVFYLALLGTTLVHLVLMFSYSRPLLGEVFAGYLGLVALGGLFIAIGILASTLTRHQLLAATLAIAILSIFTFVADYMAEFGWNRPARTVAANVNVINSLGDFTRGYISFYSVLFFVLTTVFFLFLATKVLESRRWR